MTVFSLGSTASPARGAGGTGRDTGGKAFTQRFARRTPWKFAIRVAIVIVAMSGNAYYHVFSMVTGKSLEPHGGGIEVETEQGHHTTIHLWFDPSDGAENAAA